MELLEAQQRTIVRPPPPSPPSPPRKDLTFGIHATGDGRNAMGNSIVHIEGNTLKVDDKDYELTPGLRMLILYKKPRPQHYSSGGYSVYKAIVVQTRVRAYSNKCIGCARPRSTWKWKHMLRGMAIPRDIVEEEEGMSKVVGHHLISCPRLTFHQLLSLELVHVLDAFLRLKQLTRREYTDINNRLASA